jgi:hypothetical protein
MNDQTPCLQIRLHWTDGTSRMLAQHDSDLANRALMKLNPAKLFAEDRIKIPDGDSEITFATSALARIDLITDRLSVWDFPFVLGAHVELTQTEFRECLDHPQPWKSPGWHGDMPLFLEISMARNQGYFFWMEVATGLSAVRMSRIQAMLKDPCLIFGLRTVGIGVLNLANMEDFAVHPEPPDAMPEARCATYEIDRKKFGLPKFRIRQLADGSPH